MPKTIKLINIIASFRRLAKSTINIAPYVCGGPPSGHCPSKHFNRADRVGYHHPATATSG